MLERIKNVILALVVGTVMLAPASAGAASIVDQLCAGANAGTSSTTTNLVSSDATGDGSCAQSGASGGGGALSKILKLVVNVLSIVVGFVAVIMIVVAGFRYITSGGESGKVTGAKNAIVYAIVGLIIVAIAQVIVHFVLAKSSTIGS